jgi:hypothetical protein
MSLAEKSGQDVACKVVPNQSFISEIGDSWSEGFEKMDTEYQQVFLIFLGGVLVWGVTITLGVITLKIQMPTFLKAGCVMALMSGILFSVFYPIAISIKLEEYSGSKFIYQVLTFIILFFAMTLFSFLVMTYRWWSMDRSNRWLLNFEKLMSPGSLYVR